MAVVSLLAASCGVKVKKTTKVPVSAMRPAKEATLGDLVARYNQQAEAIRSVNAALEFHPVTGTSYSGVIEQYHDVRGFVLGKKPASIRVIGQAPVVGTKVFDMVSDGVTFRISIPPKNKFIVGPANLERAAKSAIENLRPQHLVDAFFWAELPRGRTILFEEFDNLPDHFYVLTLLRPGGSEIEKKIWFDRTDLRVVRVQGFGAKGRLTSDIRYSDWQEAATPSASSTAATAAAGSAGAVFYPRQIRLTRPHEDYQLDMHITRLTLNEEIAADRFTLEQPPGSELVRLAEGSGEPHP